MSRIRYINEMRVVPNHPWTLNIKSRSQCNVELKKKKLNFILAGKGFIRTSSSVT